MPCLQGKRKTVSISVTVVISIITVDNINMIIASEEVDTLSSSHCYTQPRVGSDKDAEVLHNRFPGIIKV